MQNPFKAGTQWLGDIAEAFGQWLRDSAETIGHKLSATPKAMVLFCLTFAIVIALNPAKVGLVLYGVSKLCLFAQVGLWVDGWVFRNARPEDLTGAAQGTAWKRRAWIVCTAILAGALLP
jgi:hypothetical protein